MIKSIILRASARTATTAEGVPAWPLDAFTLIARCMPKSCAMLAIFATTTLVKPLNCENDVSESEKCDAKTDIRD